MSLFVHGIIPKKKGKSLFLLISVHHIWNHLYFDFPYGIEQITSQKKLS